MKGGWVGVPFSGVTCVEGQIEAKWSSSVARTLVPPVRDSVPTLLRNEESSVTVWNLTSSQQNNRSYFLLQSQLFVLLQNWSMSSWGQMLSVAQ